MFTVTEGLRVICYRVVDSDCSEELANIETYSRAPGNTNIESVLQRVAPSTSLITTTSAHSALFAIEPSEEARVSRLLDSLRPPTVVAMLEGCPLAVCLDFYSHPPGTPGMRGRTEVGGLIHEAKYQQSKEAVLALAQRAERFVVGNPLFEEASGVAAVPGSHESSGAGQLLETVVQAVSSTLGIPRVDLWRVQTTEKPQKNIDFKDGDDPNQNQKDTMVAAKTSGSVLVLDDLMRHGSSVREAGRALLARGAREVLALVLAKDLQGTGGYAFPKG